MPIAEPSQGRLHPALCGALQGACWALPFGILTTVVCLQYPPTEVRPGVIPGISLDLAILAGVAVIGIWASIAGLVGWVQAYRPPPTRREVVIQQEVARAARSATIYSSPVVIMAVVLTWGYGPGQAVLSGTMISGIWVGSAACVGLARGLSLARDLSTTTEPEAPQAGVPPQDNIP